MEGTESPSLFENLEEMPLRELLININKEDKSVPDAVEAVIPQLEQLVPVIVEKMREGGRLFYIGAGTSGRLGILDASECPPTFGVPQGLVRGIIAGGDKAIKKAVENAEDDENQGWEDLQKYNISTTDVLIGIAASGKTPYVVAALRTAQKNDIFTACITCNPNTPLSKVSNVAIEVITGPEFITGSTRLKAGTAQKLVLNMISTSVMIGLGKVKGNMMVDMKLTNNKLFRRGTRILTGEFNMKKVEAERMLRKYGSVRKVIEIILGKDA